MISQTLFLVVTETESKRNIYVCEHLITFLRAQERKHHLISTSKHCVRMKLTCGLYILNQVLVKLFNLSDTVIQKYFVFFSFSIYLI